MKEWMSIRVKTEARFPGRCQLFEVEGTCLRGAVIPHGEELNLDFSDVTLARGVYVLENAIEQGQMPKIYIGLSLHLRTRIQSHEASRTWQRAILMASNRREMGESHFKAVESRLISFAMEAPLVEVENQVLPQMPGLATDDRFEVDRFVEAAVRCLRYFGVPIPDHSRAPEDYVS